jgi:hypothetical protein
MNTFRVSSNTRTPVGTITPNDWVQTYTIEGKHKWSEFDGNKGLVIESKDDLYEALYEGSKGNGKPWCRVNVNIEGCGFKILFNLMNRTHSDGDFIVISRLLDDTGTIREFSLNFSEDRGQVTLHLESK